MSKRKHKDDLIDKAINFIEQKLRDASLRDLAFLSAFLGGTFLAYSSIKGVSSLAIPFSKMSKAGGPKTVGEIFPVIGVLSEDPIALASAMVASYKLLTSDTEDLMTAIAQIKSL